MSSSEFSILERILGRFVHFSVTTKYLIQPNFTQSQNSRGGKGPPEVICSNHPTHAGPPWASCPGPCQGSKNGDSISLEFCKITSLFCIIMCLAFWNVPKDTSISTYSLIYGQWLNVWMETSDEWSPSGVRTGTGAVQYIYQWRGQRHRVYPQQVCRWHQAEWYGWDTRRTGCHPEGPGQAGEVALCEPHEVQQGRVQGPTPGLG